MAVPNIFGSATSAIPLSQLDTNFATPVTIGNTAVQLGNTVTSFGNVTLTNVTISSGNVTLTGANVSGTANVSTLIVTGNATISGTATTIQGLTVGLGAGAVSTNTAVGASALAANTSGNQNTAVGISALANNTTGNSNSAFGRQALALTTTGGSNTAVGVDALVSSTTATVNTAVGYQSGYNNTTGAANAFFGTNSGFSATTANYNTFIGREAGYSVTTGGFNTFVGQASGYYVTTGTKNTIIGQYSGNQGGLDIRTASNYIVLSDGDGTPWASLKSGSFSLAGNSSTDCGGLLLKNNVDATSWRIASNTSDFFIANSGFTRYAGLISQSFTAWTFSSDRRIKTDIVDIEYGLDAVMAMKPRKYKMLESNQISIGFVAQELKEIVPEAVTGEEIEYLDTDTPQEKASKTMGVSKDLLIPVLVKAIQELKAEFDAYKEAHP